MRFQIITSSILFFLIGSCSQTNETLRPNIIYIYADDLGYGELGCYGQQKIQTPNLDRMATEGIRFTQHYTSAPVCAPARCMLLTGKHSGHSYIRGNYELGGFADDKEGGQMPLPECSFTIADLLKKQGYVTGAIGKWGLGIYQSTGDPNKHGFDYFYGYLDQKQAHNYYPTHLWENGKKDSLSNPYFFVHRAAQEGDTINPDYDSYKGKEYSPEKMLEKAVSFIREHKDEPFFLYLPVTLPHLSLQVPDSLLEMYKDKFEEKPYNGQKGYVPNRYPRATYAAMISYMDQMVGTIMGLLKKLDIDNNTLVIFTSDNGPTFDAGGVDTDFFNSSGDLRGKKQDLYEGGIREPMIARWPGKIAASTTSDLVSVQYDLMATLGELLKIEPPDNDGISFLPAMLGKEADQEKHEYIYFEFPEKGGQVSIRYGNWKGIRTGMKANPEAPWEIYDLSTDMGEKNNLAGSHPELIDSFNRIIRKEHQHSHIREWEFIDPKF